MKRVVATLLPLMAACFAGCPRDEVDPPAANQTQASPQVSAPAVLSPTAAKAAPVVATPAAAAPAAPVPAAPSAGPASDTAGSPPAVAPAVPLDAEHARVAEVLKYDPADPLADLEKADALDRAAGQGKKLDAKIPKRGCALIESPRRIWPGRGIATVAALGDDFVIAGYAPDAQGERLFVVQLTAAGKAEPVASLRVEPPHPGVRAAPPGLAANESFGVTLAYANGAGVLLMQRLQLGSSHGATQSVELGRGVDTRFAPAVAYGKRGPLVAYTQGTTPMRTQLVRIGAKSEILGTHDITPTAMGAAAPAFVLGARPLAIVTADARNGMSPIARTTLADDGTPRGSDLVTPVGMMSQPPQLTAAASSFGTFVGYTGLGTAATSAVGLVQIAPKPGAPEALVKGIAYGALHVAAVAGEDTLVLAADAPKAAGKAPSHTIQLTRVDEKGRGTPLSIESVTGDATQVGLARADDGRLGVVFSASDAVYFAQARCDEPRELPALPAPPHASSDHHAP